MASNSSSNSSDFFKDYVKSKINFLLIATDDVAILVGQKRLRYILISNKEFLLRLP